MAEWIDVHALTQPKLASAWNNADAIRSIESDMNHLARAQMYSRILANIFLKVCMRYGPWPLFDHSRRNLGRVMTDNNNRALEGSTKATTGRREIR
jgi:hypothetical protein